MFVRLYRLCRSVCLAALVAGANLLIAAPGQAQVSPDNRISLARLNSSGVTVHGPADENSFGFRLPADWDLTSGSQFHLDIAVFSTGATITDTSAANTRAAIGGGLEVLLNNISLGTVAIDQAGLQSAVLTIPEAAWSAVPRTADEKLTFRLRTAQRCELSDTTVIVRPSSYLELPHQGRALPLDLKSLPYPFFQGSFTPDRAVLVMPAQPTAGELQAALTTAAAFGRMTSGKLSLTYTTADHFDTSQLIGAHVIFVGRPGSLPQLAALTLPVPPRGAGFAAPEITATDGVLQLAASPWDSTKAVLVVSGQEDAGVIKASQAIGAGLIRTTRQTNLAVVIEARPAASTSLTPTDFSLDDLGYGTQTLFGPGVRTLAYWFEIPEGQAVNGDAYFDLVFTQAAMFDFQQAGLSVSLNDQFVGSLRFSDRTTKISNWHVNLPPAAFHAGSNLLLLQADLKPAGLCVDDQATQLWFSARAESTLHVPLGPARTVVRTTLLRDYPTPFTPTFERTAFVVARGDSMSWIMAAQLAFDLGQRTGGVLINPIAVFADAVPNAIRQQYDLLVVGRPSTLPLLSDMSKAMPAPFAAGSDLATEPAASLTFRVSADAPIGYLQVFPAPWDAQRKILAVLSNGQEGLGWAVSALIDPSVRSGLNGNYAVINGDQIITRLVPPPAAPGAAPASVQITPTPSVASSNAAGSPPLWIAIAIILVVVVGFSGVALSLWVRRRRAKA